MRARKWVVAGLLVLLTYSGRAQQEQRSALLPASEVKGVAARYPKTGPNRITGAWEPTKADIDGLEANLHQISDLSRRSASPSLRIEHPENYIRQYVGVLQAGKKRIFVYASCGFNGNQPPPSPFWRDHLIFVSDGGNCVWQSLYDPSSKTFLELRINGV
ncbi:MAG: hypothetical protein ABR924_07575 [Terracidiphilus sp.]|jgi:hypothetical protein